MARVIIERPRSGGGVRSPKGEKKFWQRLNLEEAPRREKIRQKWAQGNAAKHFTDLLGPLRRFALSCVGRHWDAVYSEIRQVLSPRSKMQQHAADHLWDFIARDVVHVENGIPYRRRNHRWQDNPLIPCHQPVYVCPETKLIRRNPHNPRWKRTRPPRAFVVWLDEVRFIRRVEGIWYEIQPGQSRFRPVTLIPVENRIDQQIRNDPSWGQACAAQAKKQGYQAFHPERRQLGKRAIRRLRLNERAALAFGR